jgi:hypothetical protein
MASFPTHLSSSNEPNSVNRSLPHSDTSSLWDGPDQITLYPQVLSERTLVLEFSSVNHSGDFVTDFDGRVLDS